MTLYGGIDLHANNSVVVLLDEQDQVVYQKRLSNCLEQMLQQLAPYQASRRGLVVESTDNWYWLVDGLMEAGYTVHLANTAAIQQYAGLQHTDDQSDARWLAHMLRLGLLPQGYIDPKEERPVRDLLRKRGQLVRYKTAQLLSIQNLMARNTGASISGNRIQQWERDDVVGLLPDADRALAVTSTLAVMPCLADQIPLLERTVKERVKLRPAFRQLLTVSGMGDILALTIRLETGDIGRFGGVGNLASYCR
jgi:transposase